MIRVRSALPLVLASLLAAQSLGVAQAQSLAPYGAPIELATADRLIAAARAEASRLGIPVAVAVVDSDGHLVAFGREASANLGVGRLAQRKAETAVLYRTPTGAFQQAVNGGRTHLLAVDALPLEGGVLVTADGEVIGGLGVSGASDPAVDGRIAAAALAAVKLTATQESGR